MADAEFRKIRVLDEYSMTEEDTDRASELIRRSRAGDLEADKELFRICLAKVQWEVGHLLGEYENESEPMHDRIVRVARHLAGAQASLDQATHAISRAHKAETERAARIIVADVFVDMLEGAMKRRG